MFKYFDHICYLLVRLLSNFSKPSRARPLLSSKRILFIKLSAFGDALCLIPSLRQLSQYDPDLTIDFLTTYRCQPSFFRYFSLFDNCYLLPLNPVLFIFFILGFIRRIRNYDVVIDFDQFYSFPELLSVFTKYSAGFITHKKGSLYTFKYSYEPLTHEKLLFSNFVSSIFDYQPRTLDSCLLFSSSHNYTSSTDFLKLATLFNSSLPVIAVYFGCSSNVIYRRWPSHMVQELILRLSPHYNILIIGGPDEIALKQLIPNYPHIFDLINCYSLPDLAILLNQHVDLFVGNDGGLHHLAEVCNVPSISIFGPSCHNKWGSYLSSSQTLSACLSCSPCNIPYLGLTNSSCLYDDSKCMSSISVETVFQSVSSFFNK